MNTDNHPTELKNSILARIESERISPRSRWRFVCTRAFFLAASIGSVVIGAVTVAVMLFTSVNAGWEYYEMTHDNVFTFMANIIPYLWLTVLLVTAVSGYYNVRHMKHGYRYPVWVVLIGLVGSSFVGGMALYVLNVGAAVDHLAHELMPQQYKPATMMQKEMWHDPVQGRIFGVVASTSVERFWLRDINDELWEVETMALKGRDHDLVVADHDIRLVGISMIDNQHVVGCLVLPGVEESALRMHELRERRALLHQRIVKYQEPMETKGVDSRRLQFYRACHEVIASLIPAADGASATK